MSLKYALAAGAIVSSWALPRASWAQPAPAPEPQKDTMFFVANGAAVTPFGGQVDVLGGEGSVIGGVVKDKPYSADSVTESTQMLADGNRIVNRNEARVYRDSQGRTRREQTLNGLGVWQTANEPLTMVTINDPVADVSFFGPAAPHGAQAPTVPPRARRQRDLDAGRARAAARRARPRRRRGPAGARRERRGHERRARWAAAGRDRG